MPVVDNRKEVMKVFVISQPKAGTFLSLEILHQFGILKSNLFLFEKYYDKFSGSVKSSSRRSPFKKSLGLIQDGFSTAGHIGWSKDREQILEDRGFKVVLLTRPFLCSLKSWERQKRKADQPSQWGSYKTLKHRHAKVADWINVRNLYHLTFDELVGGDFQKIDELQMFLFGEIVMDSSEAVRLARLTATPTKSKERLFNESRESLGSDTVS